MNKIILLLLCISLSAGCKKARSVLKVARLATSSTEEANSGNQASFNYDKEVQSIRSCEEVNGYKCYVLSLVLSKYTSDYIDTYSKKVPELINISDEAKVIVHTTFHFKNTTVGTLPEHSFKYHARLWRVIMTTGLWPIYTFVQ